MESKSTSDEVQFVRLSLKLTQAQFGQLFGIHPMTVSKWERGALTPTPYQMALMADFKRAARDKAIKNTLAAVLVGAGITAAIYLLLKAAKEAK